MLETEETTMLLRPVVRNGRPGLIGRVYGLSMTTGSASAPGAAPMTPTGTMPGPGGLMVAPTTIPQPPSGQRAAMLGQLQQLHAQGVLNDAELASATARLPAS
jgi:hypothetical protein